MPPAMAFGQPLRNPSWGSLPLRQRLALELFEFLNVYPPARASLLTFWHGARTVSLATLALADCAGGTNVCLHVDSLDDVSPAFCSLFLCSSLVVVRSDEIDLICAGLLRRHYCCCLRMVLRRPRRPLSLAARTTRSRR